MRVVSKRWNPDRRDLNLEMPAGSVLLGVRMSPGGDCQASFAVPDHRADLEAFPIRICVENQGTIDGNPLDWVHIGSWTYASGRVAHAFRPVAVVAPLQPPALPRKRRTKAEMAAERLTTDSPDSKSQASD